MTASLKQIQALLDHLREEGAEEVTVECGRMKITVRYGQWSGRLLAEIAGNAEASATVERLTEPNPANAAGAAEQLLFGSAG